MHASPDERSHGCKNDTVIDIVKTNYAMVDVGQFLTIQACPVRQKNSGQPKKCYRSTVERSRARRLPAAYSMIPDMRFSVQTNRMSFFSITILNAIQNQISK